MKETRNFKINAGNGNLTLTGLAVVYDKPTVILDENGSSYTEIIKSGALDEADMSDCRLLYNHDSNHIPLAKTPKTMELNLSPAGLEFKADLSEGNQDVYTAVKRGDLDGCSFAFTVPEGGDSYDAETNTRTINKIKKIYELSVVPFPAYSGTSVEARSVINDAREKLENKKNVKLKLNKILFRGTQI